MTAIRPGHTGRPFIASAFLVAALALAAPPAVSAPSKGAAKTAKKKRVPEKEVAAAAAALVGADSAQAIVAANKLGEVANRTATAPLVDALSLGLAPTVAIAALGALGARGDAAALPTLEYYLKVRAKSLRSAATRAAASIPGGDAVVIAALDDPTREVRGVASEMVTSLKLGRAAPRLLELLKAGELPAADALGAIADAEIARAVAEMIGRAKDTAVAQALGTMLLRSDFGPDSLRVEVVRALAKVPKDSGVPHLAAYIAETPEKPPRESRRVAEELLGDKL